MFVKVLSHPVGEYTFSLGDWLSVGLGLWKLFSQDCHQPLATNHNRTGNTHFSHMTGGCQLVKDQYLGLCDWCLTHLILHGHCDCHTSRMANKLMSHGLISAKHKNVQFLYLLVGFMATCA